MKKGFTIIEVMMAIFVLTVAVGGSFALIQQTLVSASINQSRLTAYYLAQEGIEIVRNIRDSNWLEKRTLPAISWDEGLTDGLSMGQSEKFLAVYDSPALLSFNDKVLNLDGSGFYSYSPGTPTNFKREITIRKTSVDSFEVSVEVLWSERGRTHSVEIADHLYDWKP